MSENKTLQDLETQILAEVPDQVREMLKIEKLDDITLKVLPNKFMGNDNFKILTHKLQAFGADYITVKADEKGYFRVALGAKPKVEPKPADADGRGRNLGKDVVHETPPKTAAEVEPPTPSAAEPQPQAEPEPLPTELAKSELLVSPVTSFFGTYCVQCADYTPKAEKGKMICTGMQHAGDSVSNYAKVCVEVLKFGMYEKINNKLETISKDAALNTEWKLQQRQAHPHGAPAQPAAAQPAPAKPTPAQTPAAKKWSVEDARMLFPAEYDAMLRFEDKGSYILIAPKQFLGSETFAKIASTVRGAGGEYISAGRDSHFRMYNRGTTPPTPAAPQKAGHIENGVTWQDSETKEHKPCEKAFVADNMDKEGHVTDAYIRLFELVKQKKAENKPYIDSCFYWITEGENEYIGRVKTERRGHR